MIVNKKQNESGTFVPDIPKGLEYQSAHLNPDGQTYTLTFSESQLEAQRITPAQGRAQLHREGLLTQVASYIEQSDNEELRIFWEYATFWGKHTPTVQALAEQFQIDLDAFWAEAKAIEL